MSQIGALAWLKTQFDGNVRAEIPSPHIRAEASG